MNGFFGLVIGIIGGFLAHAIAMKVSFKQRTIENKIQVYDSLIGKWIQMRNFIYAHITSDLGNALPYQRIQEFDQIYGESQKFIGEAILVCENDSLTTEINQLNERLYRTEWHSLPLGKANEIMEDIKSNAIITVSHMREDIRSSSRLERHDFSHIISGLWKQGR